MKRIALFLALCLSCFTIGYGQVLDPVAFYSLLNEAERAAGAGDHAQAAEKYQRLVEQAPDNPALWANYLRAQYALGHIVEALDGLIRVQKLGFTFDEWATYNVALLHLQLGEEEAALEWIERAYEEGFSSRHLLRNEEALAPLYEEERFRKLAGNPPSDLDRNESWRFDLAYFVEEARRLHADPYRPAFSTEFEEAAQALHGDIPALNDEEVVLGLMQLAALLGDGHSVIYGPGDGTPLSMDGSTIPVKFYLFDEGLYIVDAETEYQHLVGQRVERIGQLTPSDALERMGAFRGVDNRMTMNWLGVQFYLRRMAMLRGIGAAVGDEVQLALLSPEGTASTVSFKGSYWDARRKLRAPARADTSLWLQHVNRNYWMKALPEGVYVQFNQVRDQEDGPSIAEFSTQLGEALLATSTNELILDLRHNNGGNNSLVRPLLRQLIGWEVADPGHRIWVLTGRNTFSAAQNFLNRVERLTDAIIVGEPSSSSPNFIGEEIEVVLPWSKVRGSISTRYWQDSDPTDRRPWIYPDLPVSLRASDYFSNRDPVIEAVLAIIRQ